ncbi:MAG: T9SS type A sorting domain-containing protein [Flavobacteriales bacterium]
MKRLSTFAWSLLTALIGANAQYCSPSFSSGCSGWHIMNVNVGSSFNWNYTDCTVWDQTAAVIMVNPVDSIPMSVTDGTWSGCAVWVDWNNSGSFEDSENLYHNYVGGDPSFTYNFNIAIPPATPEGAYRMRVIGAWGSDGFTNGSSNGYGPCGSFQYGNFNDFTLQVDNSTAVADVVASPETAFTASPNPTTGRMTLNYGQQTPKDRITLESMDGRTLRAWNGTMASTLEMDLSALPAGIYLVRNTADQASRPLRIVKQ